MTGMSNLVLYRKYRPQGFQDVVGQDVVVRTLTAALKQKSPAHAYLFVGSRGTGKTSVARIFARELGVTDKDTVEIDAASNRKIEHVRDLREMVQKLPFESPYTVYIIDEVHMLTTEAFNALLKTLEEPPKHVIFILATTELDRVPDTIKSRCQILSFETPSSQEIVLCLKNASEKEGVTISEEALNQLARHASGSYRDALGLLGRVIQVAGKKITESSLAEMGMRNAPRDATTAVSALVAKDAQTALPIFHAHGGSIRGAMLFWESCIEIVEKGILLRLKAVDEDILKSYQPETRDLIHEIAGKPEINSKYLDSMLAYHQTLSVSTLPKVVLTAAVSALTE